MNARQLPGGYLVIDMTDPGIRGGPDMLLRWTWSVPETLPGGSPIVSMI